MSTIVNSRIIRIAFDIVDRTTEQFPDVNTNATPELWQGNDVQFQIGIFRNGVIVDDVSNIASLTLDVRIASATGTLLMTKTLAPSGLSDCAADAWTAGTGQHAIVSFTGTEANVAAGDNFLVVGIITTDSPGKNITLGATILTIAADGIGSESSPQVLDGLAYTKAQADARYIPLTCSAVRTDPTTGIRYHYIAGPNLWYPEVAVLRDGVPQLVLGTGVTLP